MAVIRPELTYKIYSFPQIPKFSQSIICIRNAQTPAKILTCTSLNAHNTGLPVLHCCQSSVPPADEDNSPSTRIFIKGLSPTTTEAFLAKAFSNFGKVNRVKIIMDRKREHSLGFAYIWFTNEGSAQSAVKEMDGEFFCGRFIAVTIARPETPSSHVKSTYIF